MQQGRGSGVAPSGGVTSNSRPSSGKSLPAPSAAAKAYAEPPSVPVSPATKAPDQVEVNWDGHDLFITARNASLHAVLREVAARIGAVFEAPGEDQRVFGTFGPGPGCDVLSTLLEGAGYNVLMLGSRETDAPLRILLSARMAGRRPQQNDRQQSSDAREEETIPSPANPSEALPRQERDPFAVGEPPQDPASLMEQILQRQQKIDQQQQEEQLKKQAPFGTGG